MEVLQEDALQSDAAFQGHLVASAVGSLRVSCGFMEPLWPIGLAVTGQSEDFARGGRKGPGGAAHPGVAQTLA